MGWSAAMTRGAAGSINRPKSASARLEPGDELHAGAWMVLGALCVAVMGAAVRGCKAEVSWQLIVLARAGVAVVLALAMGRLSSISFPWRAPSQLWVRSLCAADWILAGFYASTCLPIADAVALVNASPVGGTVGCADGDTPSRTRAAVGLAGHCRDGLGRSTALRDWQTSLSSAPLRRAPSPA